MKRKKIKNQRRKNQKNEKITGSADRLIFLPAGHSDQTLTTVTDNILIKILKKNDLPACGPVSWFFWFKPPINCPDPVICLLYV
jgi:hypothetical protein